MGQRHRSIMSLHKHQTQEEQGPISRNSTVSRTMGHRKSVVLISTRHPKRYLIAFLGILLILGQNWWLPFIGRFLIVTDPISKADALVPLAGEPSRTFFAAQLFMQGYAKWFVVTDMQLPDSYPKHAYVDWVRQTAHDEGVPMELILSARGTASTTYGEAVHLRQLAEEQEWRSLIVVTSPSHTRRTRIIFRSVFDTTQIDVSVFPVEQHRYTPHTWWKIQGGMAETGREYVKMAAYYAGYHAIWPDD